MSPDDVRKPKSNPQPKNGFRQTLEGILERLREGLENLTGGLANRQPVPIPIPLREPRRR